LQAFIEQKDVISVAKRTSCHMHVVNEYNAAHSFIIFCSKITNAFYVALSNQYRLLLHKETDISTWCNFIDEQLYIATLWMYQLCAECPFALSQISTEKQNFFGRISSLYKLFLVLWCYYCLLIVLKIQRLERNVYKDCIDKMHHLNCTDEIFSLH
jgi:hypothetical protein